MKKIFSLAFVLVAMFIGAHAQITDDFESYTAFTVDPTGTWTYYDGDGLDTYGFNGVSFSNAYYTGSCIVFNPTQTSPDVSTNYPAHSGSQYLIIFNGVPDSETGVSTTNDWIISPALSFTGTATLSFYAREIVSTYGPEVMKIWYSTTTNSPSAFTLLQTDSVSATDWTLYSYAIPQNATYVAINCNSDDVFGLMIDDISIMQAPTTPTIVCGASSLDFGTVLIGQSSERTAQVTAYNLTAGITATTAAPFSVSADGNTYGTTATVAQTGGTLYVKYAPTAAGTSSDIVVLSSTGAGNDTIVLTGNGLDCSNVSIPYNFDFNDAGLAECWTIVDANNDGSTFSIGSGYASYLYNTTNAADDWLISPEFTFTGNEMASFDYWCYSSTWPERFMVFALGADTVMLVDTVVVSNTSSAPATQYMSLSSLTGAYRIGIHCISEENQFRLYIDNFSVTSAATSISVNPVSIDFGVIPASNTENATFVATILNASSDITVTTAAPFSVSLDNNTYAASVTIPTPSTSVMTQTIYVGFTPTAGTTYTGEVVLSTTGAADTVALFGEGIVCDAITTFPFTENFADASTTLPCWEIVDANNDDNTFEIGDGEVVYSYSSDENANDYLISPELTLTSGLYGHIDYAVASAGYPEKLSVYVIPENGTIANAVNIVPTMTITNEDPATLPFDLSAYANQTIRVAFKAESDADMYELILTNFMVEALPASATITVDPTSMDFITEVGNTTREQAANVTAFVLTNDITLSTAAPFEVSLDGNTYGTSATIPAGNIVSTTIYVHYAPTTPGTQTGTLTLTSGSATATISLTGEGVDCSAGIASLPFIHDFNDAVIPPFCWSYENEESFLRLNVDEETGDYGVAIGQVDYLMTPEIHTTTSMNFSFDYATYGGSASSSTFRVGYASTNNINNFTWLTPVTVTEDIEGFERYSANIPSGAKYIAIQATEIGEFQYWFSMYPNYVLLDNITIAEGDGIEDITSEDNVSIYPNPANNVINVNAASNINNVEIFNMMGQKVAAFDANDTHVQINTTALSNGMYLMRITTENGVSNQKFTVAR